MSNLIYQVWSGTLTEECRVSSRLMQEYASRIDAEYILDIDPNIASKICDVPKYFEWLNPILDDRFLKYDKILSVDLDVFPVEGLTESIFDQDIGDIGVCAEKFQGISRATTTVAGCINKENDERWARVVNEKWSANFPRDNQGHLKIYNAGVVVFSREGILKAKKWIPFQQYINYIRTHGFGRFYWVDQNYLHAMLCTDKTLKYVEMPNTWNSQIHYVRGPLTAAYGKVNDERTAETKFVHVQMSGMNWNEEGLYQIVNLPQEKWRFKY